MSDLLTFTPPLPWLPRADDGAYGRCLAGVLDLTGGTSTGRQALSEALAKRLITEQGTLIDDPDYGFDLTAYINEAIDDRALSEISGRVGNEMLKDDRVLSCSVVVSFIGGVLVIAATIVDRVGPFALTLTVDEVTVSILRIASTP